MTQPQNNIRRYLVAALFCLATAYVIDLVVDPFVMNRVGYGITSIEKVKDFAYQNQALEGATWLLFVGQIGFCILFIYRILHDGERSSVAEGMAYGLMIGVFYAGIHILLAFWVTPTPNAIMVGDTLGHVILFLPLFGVLFAYLMQETPEPTVVDLTTGNIEPIDPAWVEEADPDKD